jgi:beta-phosphoglucomutase-like phosphatase (HAD superfamily)
MAEPTRVNGLDLLHLRHQQQHSFPLADVGVIAVAEHTDRTEAVRAYTFMRSVRLGRAVSSIEYQRDFADLGVAHLVDSIIASLDIGFRKPHSAIFKAAIFEAGCDAAECVMIGNSDTKDIEPAIQLGMRAIRVAIEEPPPPPISAAEAVLTGLAAVEQLIAQRCEVS